MADTIESDWTCTNSTSLKAPFFVAKRLAPKFNGNSAGVYFTLR